MKYRVGFALVLIAGLGIVLLNTDVLNSMRAEQENTETNPQQDASNRVSGKITDTITVPGYTYVEVDAGDRKVWAAVPGTAGTIGDEVSFSTGTLMQDFYSKSLQRDFPIIYFVERIDGENETASTSAVISAAHGQSGQEPAVEPVTEIVKAEGGYTIAEIRAGKAELNGELIRVRGQVTKYTAGVLDKNWIHINDGSGAGDLTVTTYATAAIDDVVVIQGKLELDKDYGYGYVYPAILEDAEITKE